MPKAKPELHQLPIEKLIRGKFQPRRQFDADTLNELAVSIQSAGLIQPIVVRPLQNGHYEIVAGERRWRAAQIAKLDTLACLINQYTDEQAAAVTTIENINRVDLNPIEEAESYQRLVNEFNYLHEEVAAVVGKSRAKITNSLRLLKLEESVKQLLIDGKLTEGHGKILVSLPTKLQIQLAMKCVAHGWNVRKVEQESKRAQQQSTALNKPPDLELLENALSDHIGCKVNIDFADKKGQLTIDFHNLEILEGLFEKMGFKSGFPIEE
jgi:ParB family chromosome partitioning protein